MSLTEKTNSPSALVTIAQVLKPTINVVVEQEHLKKNRQQDLHFEYSTPLSKENAIRRQAMGWGPDIQYWFFMLMIACMLTILAVALFPLIWQYDPFWDCFWQTFMAPHPEYAFAPEWVGVYTIKEHRFLYCLMSYLSFAFTAIISVTILAAARDRFKRFTVIDWIKPSHIVSSPRGLYFAIPIFGRRFSLPILDWKNVVSVSAIQDETQEQTTIVFSKTKGTTFLRADSLSAPGDWQKLLRHVEKFVPDVHLAPDLEAELKPVTLSQCYTEMWFAGLQSSTRQRAEELEAGGQLQNGTFKILKKLGSGGQGVAYLADRISEPGRTSVPVVLKEYVLPTGVSVDVRKKVINTCLKEVTLLSRLTHPNIVELYDVFVEDERTYLVMEYANGRSLRDAVMENGPLCAETLAPILVQMCEVLKYLHQQSPEVVHQDFTPDNLILADNGTLKLLDFSLARQSTSKRTAIVVGKQAYIAPEQFRGTPCSQSDLYSMGATIFFLLTGKEPTPLKQSRPDYQGETPETRIYCELVWQLTTFEVEDRLQSAEAVLQILAGDQLVK